MDGKLRNMTSLYLVKGDEMLLLYRIGSRVVAPSWCGVGGHFEEGELNDARACVLRELREEMGISEHMLDDLRLRYITLRLKESEIRQVYYFFAILKPTASVTLICDEGKPEWVKREDVLKKEMPYTAKHVLRHYLNTGKDSDTVYGGIATRHGVVFTKLEAF